MREVLYSSECLNCRKYGWNTGVEQTGDVIVRQQPAKAGLLTVSQGEGTRESAATVVIIVGP